MTKRSISSGAVLLALALLFIAITVLANYALRGWRLDLTENRLYTTAPGTDRILKSIKEPINLYFFFSEKTANQLPQLKSYGIRVRELLEELAARSGGKVRLHVIDPQPFSEEEDRADALGVDGTPVGASGAKLYLGLAGTNSTDGHAAIEFFDPNKEQFLEYDVIKLIYQLANPKKPVLAWLTTLPMEPGFDQQSGQMREPWVIYSEAQQLFDVRPLAPTAAKIDPDVSVLVLVHPKNLSPATRFAIDQFALRGGHIMVFVDPIAEADRSGADPQNPMASMDADKSSSLPQLLTAWGVHFDPTQVVADRDHALSVTMRQGEAPVEHLGVLGFDKASFAPNDVITAGLSVVNVATAGHLEPVKGAHTKFEPLLQSSTDSELLPVERFRMLFDPSTLREGFKPTGVRYTIAARVTGDVRHRVPGRTTPRSHAAARTDRPQDLGEAAEPGGVRRHRPAVRLPVGARAEHVGPAPDAGLGQQRRPGAECARQPRRQRRPDQRARARLLRAAVRARSAAAAHRRRPLPRQGAGAPAAAAVHRAEAHAAAIGQGRGFLSAHHHAGAGAGDRAVRAGEAPDPQAAARGARRARRGDPPPGQHAQDTQHHRDAGAVCAPCPRSGRVAPRAAPGAPVSPRRVAALLAAALALIVFAIWLSSQRHLERSSEAGDLVLPGLEPVLNSVTRIAVKKGDGTHVTLERAGNHWTVAERAWPADFSKVRKLLLDLGALNVVEEKTRLPANYPRLGVEDVNSAKATGTEVDVVTPTKTFALIVGRPSDAKSGYVRVAGAEQSLLAAPTVSVDAEPKSWLDNTLINIAAERVRAIEERPAAGAGFNATRDKKEQTDFAVSPIPAGRALTTAAAADPIASSMSALTLEDVQKGTAPADAKVSHAILQTFDGLAIDAAGRKDGSRMLITFNPTSTGKAAETEAQQLNARLGGWEFEIPEYRYTAIFRTLDDLLKPLPQPKKKAVKASAAK